MVREKKRTRDEPIEMTYDEANERFNGEWVLMKILEFGEYHWPGRGIVLAHPKRRKPVQERLAQEPKPSQLPPGTPEPHYSIFAAYPRKRSGAEWRATIERASKLPDSKLPRLW
jgi:hypothetical protein